MCACGVTSGGPRSIGGICPLCGRRREAGEGERGVASVQPRRLRSGAKINIFFIYIRRKAAEGEKSFLFPYKSRNRSMRSTQEKSIQEMARNIYLYYYFFCFLFSSSWVIRSGKEENALMKAEREEKRRLNDRRRHGNSSSSSLSCFGGGQQICETPPPPFSKTIALL